MTALLTKVSGARDKVKRTKWDPLVVEASMKAIAPSASISCHRYFEVPGLRPEEDGAAERLVRQITGDNGTHVVSYGTEAGQFQRENYSAIICPIVYTPQHRLYHISIVVIVTSSKQQ